jgi:hypothetical protein
LPGWNPSLAEREIAPKPDYTIATDAGAVIAEVTHTDITNPHTGETAILPETLVPAVRKMLTAIRKHHKGMKPSLKRSCPAFFNVRITADANGCTVQPQICNTGIEPITVPLVSIGTPLDIILDEASADTLLHALTPKRDAVLSVADAPASNPYTGAKDGPLHPYLHIRQQSAAVGRFDTCRLILQPAA